MFELYFLCPKIFFIFAVVFPISINQKIPLWMDVDIGPIHAEDIRRMNSEECNYLRRQVMIYFSLAFIITLSISIIFYIFTDVNSILSLITCNVIGLILGLATTLLPITKIATKLKKKVNSL